MRASTRRVPKKLKNRQAKWAATSWAKRSAAKAAKAALTDLGRFQAKVAHQARAKAVKATMAQ